MLEILTCEQSSPEWFSARKGIPTASEFKTVLASGRGGGESKGRATYLRKLAGEIITGEPIEDYSNAYMERGKEQEPELRGLYCMLQNCDVQQVGFLKDGRKGASPDGLVGSDGMLEIKSQSPHLLIQTILANEVPPEHKAQLQGNLWVGGRSWIDICVGFRKMPPVIKRVYRDEAYIRALSIEVDRFLEELDGIVAKVRVYV